LRTDLRLELIVAHEQLDLAPEDAALGVEDVHAELRALFHVAGNGRERSRQRQWKPDAHRIFALRTEHRGDSEGRGAGRGSGQKHTTIHGRLLCQGEWRR
jgi:hypothetical protein